MSDQALQVMQRDYLGIPGDLSTPLFGQEFKNKLPFRICGTVSPPPFWFAQHDLIYYKTNQICIQKYVASTCARNLLVLLALCKF
jgi:hypothetical protein